MIDRMNSCDSHRNVRTFGPCWKVRGGNHGPAGLKQRVLVLISHVPHGSVEILMTPACETP